MSSACGQVSTGGWGSSRRHRDKPSTSICPSSEERRRGHTHGDGGNAVLSFLPCREMNELAREPRSLYPASTARRKQTETRRRESSMKTDGWRNTWTPPTNTPSIWLKLSTCFLFIYFSIFCDVLKVFISKLLFHCLFIICK